MARWETSPMSIASPPTPGPSPASPDEAVSTNRTGFVNENRHVGSSLEEARAQSEERYALAMESINEGVYDWNVETGETYFSPPLRIMLGTVLTALAPLDVEAALAAAQRLEADHDGALAQWRLVVERASYEAQRAERRYHAVDPDNRLVARGLEAEWENCLRALDKAKAELAQREALRPRTLSAQERAQLLALGTDLLAIWQAPTTSPRDKKELLRAVIEEVIITVDKDHNRAHLTLRWRGDAIVEIDLDLPRRSEMVRTDEDTVALVRRLANHYPDGVIAGILNRQQRKTAYGHRFTANLVSSLRRNWDIPCFERPTTPPDGELLTVAQIASELGVATSTVHRWVNDGTIAGEQLTPGAPWRIRLTDELRARVAEQAPDGYLTMFQTMRQLGVSRQTVLQRVKRGEINAIHVKQGRQKGLRLRVIQPQPDLFNQTSKPRV